MPLASTCTSQGRASGMPAPAAKASASQPTGALTGLPPARSTFFSPEASGDAPSAVPLDQRIALSAEEAGALLGISPDLAYDLVARRELPAVRLLSGRFGRRTVQTSEQLLCWLQKLRAARPPSPRRRAGSRPRSLV